MACELTCTTCGSTKSVEEFNKDRSKKTGRRRQCKACVSANWDAVKGPASREKMRAHQQALRDKAASHPRTPRCEICGEGFTPAKYRGGYWDHNHATKTHRGWLCTRCNTGLGLFGDNPRALERASEYLRERGFAATRPVFR